MLLIKKKLCSVIFTFDFKVIFIFAITNLHTVFVLIVLLTVYLSLMCKTYIS